MGYGKRVLVDIYTMGKKKIGTLYDSTAPQAGQIQQIEYSRERNGWKELSFNVPVMVDGERNWRADLIENEYLVRRDDGKEVEWFSVSIPEDSHTGKEAMIHVQCPHISAIQKKRNLHVSFDDTNGIGTVGELARRALQGTEWGLGQVDTIYEADGVTEKIRSYSCSEKKGAYAMLTEICEKFGCYPVFHGDTRTIDICARANRRGMLEATISKNLISLKRKRDSSDLVTRLYVEGEYGDNGYVGIEDVNPTGLGFLLNFDYYRGLGLFTQEHEKALSAYLSEVAETKTKITEIAGKVQKNTTALSGKWGSAGYVLYTVNNGRYEQTTYGGGADSEDEVKIGDTVALIKADGSYEYVKLESLTASADIQYGVKFLSAVAGTLGGKEVALEAKRGTILTLTEKLNKADTQTERRDLQTQIDKAQGEADALKADCAALMLECVALAKEIGIDGEAVNTLQNKLEQIEQTFTNAMGAFLQDGYYSDDTYAAGQEAALYEDAMELLKVIAYPQYTYSLSENDLSGVSGYEDEDFDVNTAVHIICDEIRVNDYGFVSKVTDVDDSPNGRTFTVETDEMNIGSKTFESFLSRITDAAQMLKDEQAIYRRAEAFSPNGLLYTGKLDGVIDVLRNQLSSATSNWYTDANGNMIFESLDGDSAMMLCGSGFMCADGKTESGTWNWRTFGTGKGFTADLITAGVLRAGVITILGSDQFLWNGENIYVIDPTNENRQIRIGRYDGEHLGIAYTQDNGMTWQTAIGFDGIHLSAVDLEVGARNLLLDTNWEQQITSDSGSTYRYCYLPESVNLTALKNKRVVFSFSAECTGDYVDAENIEEYEYGWFGGVVFAVWQDSNGNNPPTTIRYEALNNVGTERKRVSVEIQLASPAGYDVLQDVHVGVFTTVRPKEDQAIWSIGYPKQELGNVATDWTSSPEDAVNSLQNLADKTTTSEAELTIKTDRIESSVRKHTAELTTLGTKVVDTETKIQQTANEIQQTATKVEELNGAVAEQASTLQQTADAIMTEVNRKADADEVSSQIQQSANEIMQVVNSKVGAEEVESAVKQSADEIMLEVRKPAAEVDTGSGIVINERGVYVSGGEIDLRTDDGEQHLNITPDSIDASSIKSPTVAPRYNGVTLLTVNPNATAEQVAQLGVYRSLSDAFAQVNHKQLDSKVVINCSDGVIVYGDVALSGVCGGDIEISGINATLYGNLTLEKCSCKIQIDGLTIATKSASALIVNACTYVNLQSCEMISADKSAVAIADGARVYATDCTLISEIGYAAMVTNAAFGVFVNCIGTGALIVQFASLAAMGTVPDGGCLNWGGSLMSADEVTPTNADGETLVPEEPTTTIYNMTASDSYAGGSWSWFEDADIRQGMAGNSGRIRGCAWFDVAAIRTELEGKTIHQVSLRLKMLSGYGRGVAVSVQLYGTDMEYDGRTGAPALVTSYGTIGSTNPGEVNVITLPNQVVQDLIGGDICALVLQSDDEALYQDRSYSRNYARFAGATSGSAETIPALTVVYQ